VAGCYDDNNEALGFVKCYRQCTGSLRFLYFVWKQHLLLCAS